MKITPEKKYSTKRVVRVFAAADAAVTILRLDSYEIVDLDGIEFFRWHAQMEGEDLRILLSDQWPHGPHSNQLDVWYGRQKTMSINFDHTKRVTHIISFRPGDWEYHINYVAEEATRYSESKLKAKAIMMAREVAAAGGAK